MINNSLPWCRAGRLPCLGIQNECVYVRVEGLVVVVWVLVGGCVVRIIHTDIHRPLILHTNTQFTLYEKLKLFTSGLHQSSTSQLKGIFSLFHWSCVLLFIQYLCLALDYSTSNCPPLQRPALSLSSPLFFHSIFLHRSKHAELGWSGGLCTDHHLHSQSTGSLIYWWCWGLLMPIASPLLTEPAWAPTLTVIWGPRDGERQTVEETVSGLLWKLWLKSGKSTPAGGTLV